MIIFVFGSNLRGRHGKGAALTAKQKYGAIQGQAEGLQGNSYAIPTKNGILQPLPLSQVKEGVDRFVEFAKANMFMTFEVSRVGCGLAGFIPEQIAPLFKDAPDNCIFADDFDEVLTSLR